jgi:phosphatidate cytidylyltransferase
MKERVISAIVALIIVIPLILIGGIAYYIGVSIISLIGYYEFLKVRENEKKITPYVKAISALAYLLIVISPLTTNINFLIDYRLIILDLFVCFLPLIILDKKDYDAEDALVLVSATLFLGIAFSYLITIRKMDVLYLIYVVLVTIMSDTFAHFFGTKIGKHKLCPAVSPNKTVEGMIGGVFFGTFLGTVFFKTFIDVSANLFMVIVISLALSLVAEFGDLVFSAIKRKYGVKDYGNIMPGHGGVLDRLDSILFAILAFSYLVSFF